MDQLPRLGKRELICLLLFTCNYMVFVWRGFLFLWVLGMGYVILLWHSLSLPYNYYRIHLTSKERFMVTKYTNLKNIRGMTDFSDQFRKIIMRDERKGYNPKCNATVCLLSY